MQDRFDFKINVTYSIPRFMKDAVKHFAAEEGLSQSEAIMMAVENWITEKRLDKYYPLWLKEQGLQEIDHE